MSAAPRAAEVSPTAARLPLAQSAGARRALGGRCAPGAPGAPRARAGGRSREGRARELQGKEAEESRTLDQSGQVGTKRRVNSWKEGSAESFITK